MITFEVDQTKKGIEEEEKRAAQPDFWDDNLTAQATMQRISELKERIAPWQGLSQELDDIRLLLELAEEEEHEQTAQEISLMMERLKNGLEELEFKRALSGEHDRCNVFLSIHPGAGGTESCDWAAMLLRMYLRWAEEHKYKTQIVDFLPGEEAGVKSVTVSIQGEYAYGYLKGENGVHRLVRISPFDANKRRHTSFASVFVMPEVEEVEVELNEEDLKIDTFRSSGPGGQHVNVTDSAVRITHLPTKIVVTSQNERSQHKNRANAMRVLRARLYDYYEAQQKKEMARLSGEKQEIGWGSQIRSYIFQPYTLVKDHRYNLEIGDVQRVMNGWIDPFINAAIIRMIGR